ncbi:hypothetical protein VTP01DRAFT_2687 [Rhizomucor pusillus]|uniref:uncharacterized protein n=1 Tax=Rhizomucor pusillus TaxID=4840 RepID=UPI0037425F94
MQLVVTDFYANCCRPEPLPPLNERAPFCAHVIPVVKYFNAVYKVLHLQCAEKGLTANKFMAICLPGEGQFPRKLIDNLSDRTERPIVESSGEIDDDHTMEDTLKIVEFSIQCLKLDMANHKLASFETSKKRKVLGLHYIGNKLSLLSTRALDKDRNKLKVFELLTKMNTLLQEQNVLPNALIDENIGGTINKQRTIKSING